MRRRAALITYQVWNRLATTKMHTATVQPFNFLEPAAASHHRNTPAASSSQSGRQFRPGRELRDENTKLKKMDTAAVFYSAHSIISCR